MKRYLLVMMAVIFCSSEHVFATTYDYDSLNRLVRVTYDSGFQITYAYDEVGNRTQRVSRWLADVSIDGTVNFRDFALVASYWLNTNCAYPDFCGEADINHSTAVNIEDLALLANQWLEGV